MASCEMTDAIPTVPPEGEIPASLKADKDAANDSTVVPCKRKNPELASNDDELRSSKKRGPVKSNPKAQELLPGRLVRQELLPKVQGNVCSFKGSRQLFSVMLDVLQGLSVMHEEAGILHGSVAPQHITINKDGTGTLVDWDIPAMEAISCMGFYLYQLFNL